MTLFYFLIGVAVALADFLFGDPIDWWFVILAFFVLLHLTLYTVTFAMTDH